MEEEALTCSSEGTQSSTIGKGWWEEAKPLFLFIIYYYVSLHFYTVSHQDFVICNFLNLRWKFDHYSEV